MSPVGMIEMPRKTVILTRKGKTRKYIVRGSRVSAVCKRFGKEFETDLCCESETKRLVLEKARKRESGR
jgi:hypothetical protein